MDALYALMVRLSLDVGGVGAAATAAMRAFTGIEAGATRVDRLLAGMRLTMDTRGISAGTAQAMASFRQLELQGGRLGTVFGGMNLSRSTQPLVNAVSQAQTQLSGLERAATAAESRVASLDQTMARATFLNGGAAPTSLGYQWTAQQRATAAAAATGLRGQAGLAATSFGTAQGALASQITTQMAAVDAAMMAEQARMNTGMGLLVAGGLVTGVGLAGVAAMKGWVDAATQVQDAMAGVSIATRGTQSDLQHIQQVAYTVSGQTQFSAPDVLAMAKLAATGGINNRTTLATMLPTLAQAAEIEYRLKGVSYQESVPAMVSIAHQFQSYGAQPGMNPQQAATANTAFQSLIGRVVQAQTVSNLTPTELERSLAYLTSAHAGLGVSPAQAIEFTAFASNVGLTGGQGGGARLRAFFQRLAGPGVNAKGQPASNAWSQSLADIQQRGGGSFFDDKGTFGGVQNAFAIIAKASASFGANQQQRLQEMTAAFGAPGSMIATVGSTPEAMARQKQLQQAFATDPIAFTRLAQMGLNATLIGQTITLGTNMHNLAAELGTALLPAATAALHGLVTLTGGIADFGAAHPRAVQAVAALTAAVTALALISGPILLIRGAMLLLAPGLDAVVGAGAATVGALSAVTASLGRLTAASTAATVANVAGGGAGLAGVGVAGGAASAGGIGGFLGGVGGLAGGALGGLAEAAGALAALGALPLAGTAAALIAMVGVMQWSGGLAGGVEVFKMFGVVLEGIGMQIAAVAPTIGRFVGGIFSGVGSLANGAMLKLQALVDWIKANTPAGFLTPGTAASSIDPNKTLHTAPKPGTLGSTQIFGSTVGIGSSMPPSLGHIPPVVQWNNPAAAMPVAPRGAGGQVIVHIHPGAVPIHVQTGAVKDQKKLARDLSVYVLSGIGKSIQDQTQHGAIGGAPLVPRAAW